MNTGRQFGETVEGYDIPVLNEREIRASAGILFILMFFSWMLITRTVGLLPLIFGTTRKNLYAGMIVHILANSAAFFTGIIYITRMV